MSKYAFENADGFWLTYASRNSTSAPTTGRSARTTKTKTKTKTRTGAVPGAAVRAEDGAGPVAAEGEVDDQVVRAEVLRDVAVRVREVSNRRTLLFIPTRQHKQGPILIGGSQLTQLLVLMVDAPFFKSLGTDPSLRDQK